MSDLEHARMLSRRLSVLGSTGSVGVSTLDIVRHARAQHGSDAFPIEALTANANVEMLAEQAREFRPKFVAIADVSRHAALQAALAGTGIAVASGADAILEAAARPSEIVMLAIVGCAGLPPALTAVKRGARIALANKECVVAGGEIFRETLAASRAVVIPVDSEHSAAFQMLDFFQAHAIEKLTLTASGGPFRGWKRPQMAMVTPEQAVAHPNWSMGAKISVDSATLMNKGLELIEAHYLFALPPDRLGVIVHPQSIVHCLVAYSDGAVLAHMSAPDMRTPIAHALGWPLRMNSPADRLDLAALRQLTFEEPDAACFPCLGLAAESLRAGGPAPTILNAANEVAVDAFLKRKIGFLDIPRVVEETLAQNAKDGAAADLEAVMAIDERARAVAGSICRQVAA